ncbi:Ig-like domain-containing protein [Candidatus Clostridium radicumherbarum]|uniref:Ig domain-containing protein n=1 Tax=Candidatus Clostridium radicumherbarum TaxID=3381662 RepID=A0ABW8TQI0_9CLOT
MKGKNFKKKTAFGICLLFIALQFNLFLPQKITVAAANYSWNNTVPVKYPAPGTNNGKLVLFDNSHGETTGQADWVLDGGFSDFADDLVSHGYTVQEYRGVDKNGDGCIRYYDDRQAANVDTNEAVITYDAIKNADVFVMAEVNRPFTAAEHAALKQFVDSGKGIYFIADHYNADRNMNTWDSTETYDGYNRSTSSTYNMGGAYGDLRNTQDATKGWLAENFGLRYRFNAIDLTAGFSGIKSVSDSEGITDGVQPILMAAGSTLSIVDGNKAKGIVYLAPTDNPTKWSSAVDSGIYFGGEAEGPYVAISKPSLGKAAFIGDSSPIEDITPKYKNEGSGSTKSLHDGYKSAGNAATLSVNIVNWLANTESYVGFDGVNHTKGVITPTPMADIEKNQTQAEPWATPTYDPWNTDTFAYGAYNAPTGPSSGIINVTGVTLDKSTITIGAGSSQTLTATITPSNATDKSVTWSSSNTAAATVSNGVVTGIAAGSAVITVTTTDGGKTASCNVTVTNNQGTSLINEGFDSVVGTSSSITSGIPAGWTFSSGMAIYNTTGNYGTSSPSIKLQTTGNQITTPAFNLTSQGTLSFWIKGNGTDTVSHLLVEKYDGTSWAAIEDIKPLPTTGTVKTYSLPQNIKQIRYTFTKSAGNLALDDVNISSATNQINVTGVSLDQTTLTMNPGNTQTLTATVAPSNATDKTVTWSSSNTAVASVANGVVTANGSGSTIITVTTVDGGKTASCNVNVIINVTGVTLDQSNITISAGSSQTLTAAITPTDATDKSVIWSSSNTAAATVSNGVVTGIAAGSAVITVTTTDGGKTATCNVTVTNNQGPTSINEGFDSVVGTSSSITSGIPAGWTFSSGMAIYNTTGNYGTSSPSIKLQATGNQITTPVFTLTAQGTLSFWIKGNGTDTASHLLVEKYDGTSWATIEDIKPLPTTAAVKTYSLTQNIKQIRFTYTKSVGNAALDDVKIQ